MICPRCNQNIENIDFCPFCGFEFSKENIQNIATNIKLEPRTTEYKINNNPFSCQGRMLRLPFFITNIILKVLFLFAISMIYAYMSLNLKVDLLVNLLVLGVFILVELLILIMMLFSLIKRLRDIKWSSLLCLLVFIPYVGFGLELVLIFKKSKFIN